MIKNAVHHFDMDKYDSSTVIGEFSGRDSVAAIMKAFESDDINYILPIATFAGTEYGDYDVIYENYTKLQEVIKKEYGNKKTLYKLIEYNREDVWAIMNGRYTTEIIDRFKFYNPCIGCHLYFHLTKLPFANKLSKRIISGERESHDGKIKVNQLHVSLEVYKHILKELGFELLMPLQYTEEGKDVEELLKWDWAEGGEHPKCVLSGNYRDLSNKAKYDETYMKSYFEKYLSPLGNIIGKYFLEDATMDATTDAPMDEIKEEVKKLL